MNDQSKNPQNNAHPIHDEPAFILENPEDSEGNVLFIADIHFGIEHSLAKAGAHVPSQTKSITKHIIDLCTKHLIKHLVILGDIKHTVPGTSRQEWFELPEVFDRIAEHVITIDIIPGNHDGGLRKIIGHANEKIKIHSNKGEVLFGIGVFHGHTWPSEEVLKTEHVLLAHNHPHILFVDKLGGRASYACWVRGKLYKRKALERYPEVKDFNPEMIVMPAFNDLGSGTPVNIPKPDFLGPILRNQFIDLKNSNIYLLDGTSLGKLRDIIEPNIDKFTRFSKYYSHSKHSGPSKYKKGVGRTNKKNTRKGKKPKKTNKKIKRTSKRGE
jgi:putative SbcD/Mre11-related phosphoesterase